MSDSDFVIAEALWYLKKSQEILEEGLKDPTAWRKESEKQARIMCATLPYMCLMSSLVDEPVVTADG